MHWLGFFILIYMVALYIAPRPRNLRYSFFIGLVAGLYRLYAGAILLKTVSIALSIRERSSLVVYI